MLWHIRLVGPVEVEAGYGVGVVAAELGCASVAEQVAVNSFFIFFVYFSQVFKEVYCLHYRMGAIKNIFREFKLFQLAYYFSERAVEIILDLVIGSPWNILRDFSPLVAMNLMGLYEYLFFILVPLSLLDHLI